MKVLSVAVLAVCALVGAEVSTVTVTSCVFQNNCKSSNPGNIVTIPVSNRDKVSTSSTKTSNKVDPLDAAQATSPGSQIPTTTSNTDADNLLLATGVVTESSTAGNSGETIIVYTSRYTSTVTSPSTVTSHSVSEASVPEIHTVYLPQPTVTLAASTVTVEPATVTIVQESLITSVLEHKSTGTPSFTTISQLSEPTESYSTLVLSEQPTVTVTANVLTVTPTVTSSRTLQGHSTPATKCPTQSVESEAIPSISLCYRPLPIPPKGNCHDHGDRPLRGDRYDCDYRDSRDDCQKCDDKCPDRNDNAHHCEPECRRRAHYGGRYHVKGGRARHVGNGHRRN